MKIDGRLIKKIDFTLIVVIALICVIGVLMIGSATHNYVGGSQGFIKTQISSIILGIIAIIFIMFFDYNTFARFYIPIYILCNGLLLAVLIFGKGKETWGANRWLRIAGFQFQPADFVKIGIIICLAKIIVDNKDTIHQVSTILKIGAFVAVPMVMILIQPDLGTTMAFAFFSFGMLFVAGLRYKHILISGLLGIISLPFIWMGLEDYQRTRILVFMNPEMDPMGSGYHILQSKLAVGSGMIFGKGLFKGSQTQYGFLPERHNDFIFSVIAEELGFIGVAVLILLYAIMLFRCIAIAREAKDDFGAYLVIGNTFMLAFHIFANIAMTIGLMPVTGKPLPLVSYGGTFMLANMMAIGLILNVNMRRDKINF
ncbi:rod shape-determining protein RodA [Alkaliphilus serpentinus]|uniref:Peptidoglycan glycosyltransferase RodA n=1 Tax=Alkaliphilus serpentinus TaxID=1482731 RepID=A0A833M997_9FIRM|nr:rod shape-determining protein RodA [Alkaliphilus serpentinus]KAB3529275.1 rod shape-determining protein RodA [Alkaliphilus serpentinus]